MGLVMKERIKFIILIMLMAASIFQVGILWNYQDHGLPINVLAQVFSGRIRDSRTSFDEAIRAKYFKPFRIIASEGFDNPRWILDSKSDAYRKLWLEAQAYLKSALLSKPVQYLPDTEWGKLIANRSFIFEFKADISINLVSWFLGHDETSPEGPFGVHKIIISPEEDLNYNTNTVYIRDSSGIYKYSITFIPGMMTRTEYADIIAQVRQGNQMKQYSVLKEKFNLDSIDQDIYVVLSGSKYGTYSNITCSPPQGFSTTEVYSSSDVDIMAENILGSEKYSYDRWWNEQNTIEFRTLNNVYKIYSDGFFEYKYLARSWENDKGNIEDAFIKTAAFLSRIKFLSDEPDVELYLSKVDDAGASYKFIFNYKYKDMPIYVDYKTRSENKGYLANAFEVEATEKNVISCYGLLKSFEMDRDASEYTLAFYDIIDDASRLHGYSEFKNLEGINLKEIYASYKLEYSTYSQKLAPIWVIKTSEKFYTIPMRRK